MSLINITLPTDLQQSNADVKLYVIVFGFGSLGLYDDLLISDCKVVDLCHHRKETSRTVA